MGDNEIQWEPIEQGDLNTGDKVRLTHRIGDVVHGIFRDGSNLNGWSYVETMGGHLRMSSLGGYSFERAVPERTLPTEPDIYWSPSERLHYELSSEGSWWIPSWTRVSTDRVPADLVRLVPVTEVEEAEKRIQAVCDYLNDNTGTYIATSTAATIFDLLDGEARS